MTNGRRPPIGTVKTDRFEMEYFTFGEGERELVLIPGVSVRPIVYSAGQIAHAYAEMAKAYRITCFDRKKDMESGYTVADMAEDTAEAMRLIGIRRADIVGCSQGGMIAEVIALNHPALVRRLVLASTLARANAVSDETFDAWLLLSEEGDRKALNRDIVRRVYSEEYLKKYGRLFAIMENSGTPEELHRFHILVEACRGFDVYERLGEITCPALVIGSEKDRVVGKEGLRELAEKLGCPLLLYEGYGHAVYDEAPDFQGKILEYLGKSLA